MASQAWVDTVHNTFWGQYQPTHHLGVEVLHGSLSKPTDIYRRLARIYVRSDWKETWDLISSHFNEPKSPVYNTVVLWGPAGVGNSLFLRYALARALENHIPVAFCDDKNQVLYFDTGGSQRLSYDDATDIIVDSNRRVLALFDSTIEMRTPKSPFSPTGWLKVLIVHASMVSNPIHHEEWIISTNALLRSSQVWNSTEMAKLG
ncbi:hypothetical protein C8J56DRAFT_1055207 [Mycena floridula]|nr:hypothetical protein C8J56DRAFT_1055207 [Mycena floridula]